MQLEWVLSVCCMYIMQTESLMNQPMSMWIFFIPAFATYVYFSDSRIGGNCFFSVIQDTRGAWSDIS